MLDEAKDNHTEEEEGYCNGNKANESSSVTPIAFFSILVALCGSLCTGCAVSIMTSSQQTILRKQTLPLPIYSHVESYSYD